MDAIPDSDFEDSWQFLLPDGRRLQRGRAAVELLRLLPRTRWLGRGLAVLRLTWLVDLIYRAVSVNRGRLARFFAGREGPTRVP